VVLFVGGPADGWRVEVDPAKLEVDIAINPYPPAFTPDSAVLSASTFPTFRYKQEKLCCELDEYPIYVPDTWKCNDLVEALIMNYYSGNQDRLDYIRNAKGEMYDNDDRIPVGRPYQV
jgi:hypothetical protein